MSADPKINHVLELVQAMNRAKESVHTDEEQKSLDKLKEFFKEIQRVCIKYNDEVINCDVLLKCLCTVVAIEISNRRKVKPIARIRPNDQRCANS